MVPDSVLTCVPRLQQAISFKQLPTMLLVLSRFGRAKWERQTELSNLLRIQIADAALRECKGMFVCILRASRLNNRASRAGVANDMVSPELFSQKATTSPCSLVVVEFSSQARIPCTFC